MNMRHLAPALAIGSLAAGLAQAQETPVGFVERLDVNLVTVDVVVEDRDGNPVRGLNADEFTLTENGRPVEIQHFREAKVRGSAALTAGTARESTGRETQPVAAAPIESPLHAVIYIDDANLHPLNRRKVLPHLQTWLHHLPQTARVMVVRAFRSAEVVEPFTTNRPRVVNALDELTSRYGGRGQVAAGRQDLLNDLYSERPEGLLRSEIFSYAESRHHDLGLSVHTLAGVIRQLGGLPGRKVLLYVSDGISMRPGEDLFEVLEVEFGDSVSRMRANDYDLSREFLRLSREAASARIALTSVDAAGLRPPSNADVAAYRAGRSSAADSIYLANLQAPLEMMARETGGTAIVNTNLMGEHLRQAAESLSSYYELAYTAPRAGSGRFRDIEVTVKPRSGAKVRVHHRRGYRDVDSSEEVSSAVLAALSFGHADNSMNLNLAAAEGRRNGEVSEVPITIGLPLANLTMIPDGSTSSGKITVFVGTRDTDGRFSPVEHFRLPVSVSTQALEQEPHAIYRLQHTIGVRPGRQSVAIAVRDDLTNQYSIVLGGIDA